METELKYPDITVKLVGHDGNAFSVMGKVKHALKANHIPQEEINQFFAEAMSGDYDHLLQTCMRWVNVR